MGKTHGWYYGKSINFEDTKMLSMELNQTEQTDQAKTNACVFYHYIESHIELQKNKILRKSDFITDDLIEVII